MLPPLMREPMKPAESEMMASIRVLMCPSWRKSLKGCWVLAKHFYYEGLYVKMMKRKLEDIKRTLEEHKHELRTRFGVSSIAIFGSYARGEEGELSDLDILVEFERPIGWEIVDLKDYLESLLGVKVDLITKNAAMSRKKFWEHIKGELVYV